MNLHTKIKSGVYVIAEMSANHAGKLENALLLVDEAKKMGADCLKIQTYTADTLTIDCDSDYFMCHNLWEGYKLYDLYKEAYTPWEWQKDIKERCNELGIDFLSTPFDNTAVDFLEELGVEAYKIASFELVDIPLIEYTASKGKTMIMSCGMATIEEIEDAVQACERQGNKDIILLKCCSEYPANYSDMNMMTIADMQKRFHFPIGLSDHSMGSIASIVAVSLGACVIEKHFCLDRKIKNPDSDFSMEPEEFARLIEDIHRAVQIRGNVTYELTEEEIASTKFRRSIFAVDHIKKGEVFTKENIRCIRPGYGMKPKFYRGILGKAASKDIAYGEPILSELFEE